MRRQELLIGGEHTRRASHHTPGPWRTGDADWHVIVGPHTRRNSVALACIAVVDTSDDIHEDACNAALITAAPDMFNALKEILAMTQVHDNTTGFYKPVCPYEAGRIARTAIAKTWVHNLKLNLPTKKI